MVLMNFCKTVAADETGATAIEYSLIATLIAVAIIASLGLLAEAVQAMYADVESETTTALN